MQAVSKISVSVLAKILGYTFAGYGLVCDAHFLKALFQQVRLDVGRLGLIMSSLRHEDMQVF